MSQGEEQPNSKLEMVTGNTSTIFPKKTRQFTVNREKEAVESNDCLHFEWYMKKLSNNLIF